MKTIGINKIAEVKMIYISKVKASDRPVIKSSADVFNILMETWDKGSLEYVEEFKLMLLNRANKLLGIAKISQGGISGTVTDVRIILQYALKSCASGIVLSHNHPSGNTQPSESDLKITKKIKDAAALMDIQLLDHLIITPEEKYLSMADEGVL